IILPWTQLTHFTGERFTANDCLHVLRSALFLIDCKFTSVDRDLDEPIHPLHLNLQSLSLDGERVCMDILNILTLPALITFEFSEADSSSYHEDFISFMSRSRPPLQRLSLFR
ncbi:hypothetical protein DFH09DRAFT_871344, partial [Mycena vulgaris]